MGSKVVTVNPKDLEWEPMEDIPGISSKMLRVDDETGGVTQLLKISAGFIEHRAHHTHGHTVCVVKGEILDAKTKDVVLPAGGYWYAPSGDVHGPFLYPNETIVLFITDGPFDFIED